MTTKEYLFQAGIDKERLAELLGYKSTQMITKRMDEEMPERWVRKLDELSSLEIIPEQPSSRESNDESEREPKITDESINDWLNTGGREADQDPNLNNGNFGSEVIGPQKIKLSTIEGYIKMIYGSAEALCRSRGDQIAADTIETYTDQYTEAWMDYIKFDPRIMKYLEQLQIGTPLGNLIGVHAISIGAYALARITAREIAANAAANGTGETEL